jgi:NAD(P)-dependent dehydrogenase (short-subunit alcohol dehydrogenase family)
MKTILITGGSGDLAVAIKEFFCSQFKVLSPSSKELDVTDKQSVKTYLKDKNIDVLINNAGTIHSAGILESDMALWERDIQVNLIGTYFVTKTVLHSNKDALIINIASTAAFNAYSNWSSYCSSKAAVVTLTKSIANDNFEAYVLCPGAIRTKFRDGLGLDNSNEMAPMTVVEQIKKVLDGEYKRGDVIFFRKNEIRINPSFD